MVKPSLSAWVVVRLSWQELLWFVHTWLYFLPYKCKMEDVNNFPVLEDWPSLTVLEDGPCGTELPGQPVTAIWCVLAGRTVLAQWPSHWFCLWVLCCWALQSPGGDHRLHQSGGHTVHQVCLLPWWVSPISGAAGSCLSSLGLPSRERQLQPNRWRIPLEPFGLPSQLQPLFPLWLSKRQQLAARTAHRQQARAFLGRGKKSAVCGGALPTTAEQLWLWHVCYLHRRGLMWEGQGGGLATPSRADHHPCLHHPEEGWMVQTDPEPCSEWSLLLSVFSLARWLPLTICRSAVSLYISTAGASEGTPWIQYITIYEVYFYYSLYHTP